MPIVRHLLLQTEYGRGNTIDRYFDKVEFPVG